MTYTTPSGKKVPGAVVVNEEAVFLRMCRSLREGGCAFSVRFMTKEEEKYADKRETAVS